MAFRCEAVNAGLWRRREAETDLHTIFPEMFEDQVLEACLLLKICCEVQKENPLLMAPVCC